MGKIREKLKELGLVVLAGSAIVGVTALAQKEPKIYDVPKDKCVQIEGCGELCYGGVSGSGTYNVRRNGQWRPYEITDENLTLCGCVLKRGAVTGDNLTVVNTINAVDLP